MIYHSLSGDLMWLGPHGWKIPPYTFGVVNRLFDRQGGLVNKERPFERMLIGSFCVTCLRSRAVV